MRRYPQRVFMAKLTQPKRQIFLDVLRLIAAAQMIQGHSVSAVLSPQHQRGAGFAVWSFARGLTSVLFLTTAGLAFVLAEARGHDSQARKRRSLRALRLIAIGYAMHVPYTALFGTPVARSLASALIVDVLQCIGASLLGLELLSRTVHTEQARVAMAAAVGAACFAIAPAAHTLELSGLALPLGHYLTARYGSLFPLLPWAGYVFAGFAVGTVGFRMGLRLPRLLTGSGLALLCSGLVLLRFEPPLPLGVSPGYAAVKLGCVLLLAGPLAYALREVAKLPAWLAILASETLFLYLSHVVILYADGVGLGARLGRVHGPLFGLGLAALMFLVSGLGALLFHHFMRSLRRHGRGSTRGAQLP